MQNKLLPIQGIVLFTAFSAFTGIAFADPPPPNTAPIPTIHAETRVVQIDVVVTDSRGKPVADLSKQDFTVTDEGKPRGIDIFSINRGAVDREQSRPEAKPPAPALPPNVFSNRNPGPPDVPAHSTVLILDQVNAYLEDAAYARGQVIDLMKKVPPDERIALYIIVRKRGLVLLQDYTTDRELLLKSLGKYPPRGLFPSPPPPPTHANKSGDMSPVGDALAQASAWGSGSDQPTPPGLANTEPPPGIQEKLAMWEENSLSARLSLQTLAEHLVLVPGRKSVFWITQGFPPWLMKEVGMWTPPAMDTAAWNKTITALNEANIAVNTVDSRGMFRGGNPDTGTLDTMGEIAGRTGGKAYFRRNDLDVAMEEGIEAARVSYALGFYLTDNERDNKFHALKIQADRPGLQLFYRQGYYAGNTDMPDSSGDKGGKGELESVLLNQVNSTGLGITARIDAVPGTPQGSVNIRLNLDPATLSLKEQNSGWTGKVDEMFVELNTSGETLVKLSDTKEFEVTRENRAQFDNHGISWPQSIPLIQDAARIVIAVRDSNTGHVGSLTVPLK